LTTAIKEWGLDDKVRIHDCSTDNATNAIVDHLHLASHVGHTLPLGVEKSLKVL